MYPRLKVSDCEKKYELRNITKTNFLKRSSHYSGAMLWNNLTKEAKLAETLGEFRRERSKIKLFVCVCVYIPVLTPSILFPLKNSLEFDPKKIP